ncbi:MAG: hypothetical protein V7609_1417 [Verrucomicrobiota bacterium]
MKTDTILKFVNVRPVQRSAARPDRFATYGQGQSPLQQEIAAIAKSGGRKAAVEKASAFFATDRYLGIPDPKLHELVRAESSAANARRSAETSLGKSLSAWLGERDSIALKNRIWDSVLAHTLQPAARPDEREAAFANARAFYAVEYMAKQTGTAAPLSPAQVSALRIVLSPEYVPQATSRQPSKDQEEALNLVKRSATEAAASTAILEQAARELREGAKIARSQQLRPVPIEVVEVVDDGLTRSQTKEAGAAAARPQEFEVRPEAGSPILRKTATIPPAKPWMYEAAGAASLSEPTRRLLSERKTSLGERTAAEVAGLFEDEARAKAAAFLRSTPRRDWGALAGNPAFLRLANLAAIPFTPAFETNGGSIPDTPEARGIRPLGIGDLLVVKQKLLRYVAGEVAHIENILESETKKRTHSRLRETEETIVTEIEELEETQKDLQTTERFELHKEAQKTIESSTKFEAGISLTAGYGPIKVTAHADFALNTSVSESNKTASTFAREVTERSLSRIQRRAREERTRRTLERFEESNEHSFDNTNGSGNVTGIYRWVDKYYRARVVNYGRRLMLEFIIPEPAAFYLWITANRPGQGVTLSMPPEPKIYGRRLAPGDLGKSNYLDFIAAYNVQDCPAYPEESVKVGAALTGTANENGKNGRIAASSAALVCPAGYEVDNIFYVMAMGGEAGTWMDISIAGGVLAGRVDFEGVVPISVIGWASCYHVNAGAICSLTEAAIRKWQMEAYGAIMTGYNRALASCNEQVAAARIQEGVSIQGRNPDINRKLERDELRKASLRMLTDDFARLTVGESTQANFDFHAMHDNGEYGYPEFGPNRAMFEGKAIQFFEQAFEWNNMTYRFYPYFWGRKAHWGDRYPLTDTDPVFTDFLRAGAARVIVPVHPAYPEAVLHFMHTGVIWNGGEPPLLDKPLYISIVEELRSDAQVNDDADDLHLCSADSATPCYVDEWELKLPTTLVYLQQDSVLPNFENTPDAGGGFGGNGKASVAEKLDQMGKDANVDLDWRHSVVDLLKLLGRDPSAAARRKLAQDLGSPPEVLSDSTARNQWLHAKILELLEKNGGKLPADF